MKICKLCKIQKPLSDYSKKNASKDGYDERCRTCIKQVNQKYYKEKKAKLDLKFYCKSCKCFLSNDGRKVYCDICFKDKRRNESKEYWRLKSGFYLKQQKDKNISKAKTKSTENKSYTKEDKIKKYNEKIKIIWKDSK